MSPVLTTTPATAHAHLPHTTRAILLAAATTTLGLRLRAPTAVTTTDIADAPLRPEITTTAAVAAIGNRSLILAAEVGTGSLIPMDHHPEDDATMGTRTARRTGTKVGVGGGALRPREGMETVTGTAGEATGDSSFFLFLLPFVWSPFFKDNVGLRISIGPRFCYAHELIYAESFDSEAGKGGDGRMGQV